MSLQMSIVAHRKVAKIISGWDGHIISNFQKNEIFEKEWGLQSKIKKPRFITDWHASSALLVSASRAMTP